MINDLIIDGRFITKRDTRREFLAKVILIGRTEDLKKMAAAAAKLDIDITQPAVDALEQIADRLSIFESEKVTPNSIMRRIDQFLKSN